MNIRCKFSVVGLTEHSWKGVEGPMYTVELQAAYDPSIPEDQAFARATPSGSCKFMTDRRNVLEKCRPGRSFYVELIPCDVDQSS